MTKHYSEARSASLAAIQSIALKADLLGACLIWDLSGRLRILIRPKPQVDLTTLTSQVASALDVAAEAFWTKELWIWGEDSASADRRVYESAWNAAKAVVGAPFELRELDRYLSKETWFGEPLDPPWPGIEQTPAIISFFSFKGGVGRTTALASFALYLARAKKRVAIIDLDLEAPGAGTLFSPSTGAFQYGLVDYLLERPLFKAGTGIDEYYFEYDTPDVIGDGPPIVVVPAGRIDDAFLEKLARIDYAQLFKPGEGQPLRLLLEDLRRSRKPDYILIDSRAGLHDIGGLALNGLAHLDLLFFTDTAQSLAGLGVVVEHLGRRRVQAGRDQQLCAVVQAMALPRTDEDRARRDAAFVSQVHTVFADRYYDAPDGDLPVPAVESPEQPHYAHSLGFNSDLRRASSLELMAPLLMEGDFKDFGRWVLGRLGRLKP